MANSDVPPSCNAPAARAVVAGSELVNQPSLPEESTRRREKMDAQIDSGNFTARAKV